jgi:hypothetical protein
MIFGMACQKTRPDTSLKLHLNFDMCPRQSQ